jgi:hypothetical protein
MGYKKSTANLPLQEREKLVSMNKTLVGIRCREEVLLQMELLFYDMLAFFRNNQDDPEMFLLLCELQAVQDREYRVVQNTHVSINKRVVAIKRFKTSLRQILRNAIS